MTEIFIKFLENGNEKEFIAFLKPLDNAQRKELAPIVRKLTKEYTRMGRLPGNNYGYLKGTDSHRNLLQIASFVCSNLADYEKSPYSIWMLEGEYLNKVIDWCVPSWFSEFVNKQANRENIPYYINYNRIMEMAEKGILKPSMELLAKIIPPIIFEQNKDRKWIFYPENLLKRPVTLQEHIWYLFDVETNLHYSDRFLFFGAEISKDKIGWKLVFLQYSAEGKIDRHRLLKETLLATNKNFNKVLSGWFAQLFADLEPGNRELLSLQKELFGVLSAPHSKPVNTVLNAVKKILPEKEFDVIGFFDAVPVLLTSDTKATVNATLTILEKIAQKHKNYVATIAKLACQTFIHADDELQTKAAKLITTNADTSDTIVQEELKPFLETMMSSAKKILGNFAPTPALPAQQKSTSAAITDTSAKELIPIKVIENIDDLVFLASQAFDNNQPWHIVSFPAALVQTEIKAEHIAKFEPALQRALKIVKNGINAQQGQLDRMLALFFIDVCVHWVRTYPIETKVLDDLFEIFKQVDGDKVRRWTGIEKNEFYLVRWANQEELPMYFPYRQLMIAALEKIRNNDKIPLLSAPTHEPCWIDPMAFAERLALYEANDVAPYDIDLQAAIARCYLHDTRKAIGVVKQKLSGEYRNLLLFLFEENIQPLPPFGYPPAWMTASLTRKEKLIYPAFDSFPWYEIPFSHYTGQHEWESVDEEYESSEYKAGKRVPVMRHRKTMRVLKEKIVDKESGIKKLLSKIGGKKEKARPFAICDYLHLKVQYLMTEHNDIHRLLLLTPNNPEPLLADILNQCFRYSTFWEEPEKRLATATAQALHEIWDNFGDMAHVFVATCMIGSDKTVANLAAEIWINGVTNDNINSAKIGEVIGRHERIEFAPLKRFTDLAMQRLFRISDKHNRALQIIVENTLSQLPSKPITNLKKLLDIYAELLVTNNAPIGDHQVLASFEDWKTVGTLKKTVIAMLETNKILVSKVK